MRFFLILIFLSTMMTIAKGQEPIKDYEFHFKISNLPDTADSVVYIANYYGNKQYYFDTLELDKSGSATMSGASMGGGIYSVIIQNRKSFFEFVVNEPKFSLETKHGDLVNSMKVKESVENQKFYEYLRFVEKQSTLATGLKKKLEVSEGTEKDKMKEALSKIDQEVISYKKSFMKENSSLFISKVFQASAEPDVPAYTEIEDEDERNRKRYQEFKAGYLEGLDFADERLLRTPVFHNKLNYYITKLTPQVPDSVIAAADMLVAQCGETKETKKYVIHTITSKFEDSKVMGMDAVLVHMGETYYCPDKAWWLSEEKLEKFCERINAMSPLLIGKQAPNLILLDTTGKWRNLAEIDANYTILYFWDSGCGHCKKVTPKLLEFYESYKDKGVEVYAVGTEFESKEWMKYIQKNGLNWINVSDTPEANENAYDLIKEGKTTLESLNFRDTYDIFSTPKIFLLDKDKKIVATKLSPEQVGEFIENESKRKLNQ